MLFLFPIISWTQSMEVAGYQAYADPILVQQHSSGTIFFSRPWQLFRDGFGDVTGDYWIGNDRLHLLTKDGEFRLRVDVQLSTDGSWQWAEYDTFIVHDESSKFTLHVGNFAGTAANSFLDSGVNYLDGMQFSTYDFDNDRYSSGNCASDFLAGFWYNACGRAFINSHGSSFKWTWGGSVLLTSRLTLISKW